jgi:hypothetical protein
VERIEGAESKPRDGAASVYDRWSAGSDPRTKAGHGQEEKERRPGYGICHQPP